MEIARPAMATSTGGTINFQRTSGDKQHRTADGREQNRRATIGFNENQSQHERDQHAREHNPVFKGVHFPLIAFGIPREHDDERQLGEFGRLEAHSPAKSASDARR